MAGDTYAQVVESGASEIALGNPNGAVYGRVPLDIATSLIPDAYGSHATRAANVIDASDTATQRASLRLARARGSLQVPAAVQGDDELGAVEFAGYDSLAVGVGASIVGRATFGWSPTNHGTRLLYRIVPVSSTTPQNAFSMNATTTASTFEGWRPTMRIVPFGGTGQLRDSADSQSLMTWISNTLSFFGVPTVTRRLVPLGSTTDQVITALQELGLFRQS